MKRVHTLAQCPGRGLVSPSLRGLLQHKHSNNKNWLSDSNALKNSLLQKFKHHSFEIFLFSKVLKLPPTQFRTDNRFFFNFSVTVSESHTFLWRLWGRKRFPQKSRLALFHLFRKIPISLKSTPPHQKTGKHLLDFANTYPSKWFIAN